MKIKVQKLFPAVYLFNNLFEPFSLENKSF